MIEFTERAVEILRRSYEAARRFDPDVSIRVFTGSDGIEFALAGSPEEGDEVVEGAGFHLLVERGLEGVVAVVEPHDRLVIRPHGSTPLPGEVLPGAGH